jgi:hypothetical protein
VSTNRPRRGPAVRFEWVIEKNGRRYPFVPVFLEREDHEPPQIGMLLDTGADTTVLPLAMAPMLGIDARDLRQGSVSGFGGKAISWRATNPGVTGRIGVYEINFKEIQFIAHAIPVLGCDALFGPFEIRINREEIEFREIRD